MTINVNTAAISFNIVSVANSAQTIQIGVGSATINVTTNTSNNSESVVYNGVGLFNIATPTIVVSTNATTNVTSYVISGAGAAFNIAIISTTAANPIFPLSVSTNGRYLVGANGQPFFLQGDSLWSLEVQPTRAQVDQCLNDLQSKGFNAVLFEIFEHLFSNQTPPYLNAEGNKPFTGLSGSSPPYTLDLSTPNESYFSFIDYIVNGATQRGIVCLITPAYYGFVGTQEGWSAELTADTQAHRIAYGNFLAARYKNSGVIWVMGGDNISGATLYDDIRTGMAQVATNQIISYHAARTNDGYSVFGGHAGFNLNSQYSNNATIVGDAATCYGRPGPLPFFLIEDEYENVSGESPLTQRQQAYQSLCGGACGHLYGNDPLWSFGAAADTFGPNLGNIGVNTCLNTYLNNTGRVQQIYVKQLWTAYNWWLLQPQTGLVTSTLGTGTSAITPALASDGSFAFIYTPVGAGSTVNLASLSISSIPARWYDPTNGTFTNASGTPFTNSGTHAFTTPGTNSTGDSDWILVLG